MIQDKNNQQDLFNFDKIEKEKNDHSTYKNMSKLSKEKIFEFYNNLNKEDYHKATKDDECTPMELVEHMVNYIPIEFWENNDKVVLDPCAGNGNFSAYLKFKTSTSNIWSNELSEIRFKNMKTILGFENTYNYDFFDLYSKTNKKFDLIIGNPPYSGGRNKNTSISNLFITEAINLLNDKGYLSFVAPNNWMTYNNNNPTLQKFLTEGSFLVIDNDIKKYFPKIGSSFTVFVWQKGVHDNKTHVVNNFLKKDIQKNIIIDKNIPFIPLYLSQNILNIIPKIVKDERNKFDYRCDLHNFTKKDYLSDVQNEEFPFRTIHTARKTRYSKIKQDIYDKWTIIFPLSTYYIPYIETKTNVTQSVGYISFDEKDEAEEYLDIVKRPIFKALVHITRYGNFNNIKLLRHLDFDFDSKENLTDSELKEIDELVKLIKY